MAQPRAVSAGELESDARWIYDGGSDSLVARTVGSAEGTRRSDGQRTKAYYGHTDPGNGVWNLGTFSYQHEAASPEEADEKQLRRLQRQERTAKGKAAQWKVPLSMEVRLNGLDLANQAPLAALDKGGYIERLAEAYEQGKSGEAAIAWARTHAYFDPDKQAWDAPGLGNNLYSIQRDQERRMAAIDKAMRLYKAEHVGTIEKLSELHVATAVTENPLLTEPLDSAIVDFSLKPAASSVPKPPESVDSTLSAVPADISTRLDEAIAPDNSLVFEEDLIASGEWDDGYEAIAEETTALIERELSPVLESQTKVPKDKLIQTDENASEDQLGRILKGITADKPAQLLESSAAPAEIPAFEASSVDEAAQLKLKVSMRKDKKDKQASPEKRAFFRTEDSIVPSK